MGARGLGRPLLLTLLALGLAMAGLGAESAGASERSAPTSVDRTAVAAAKKTAKKKSAKKKCKKKSRRSRKCRRQAPKRRGGSERPSPSPPSPSPPSPSPPSPSPPNGEAAKAKFTELLTGSLLERVFDNGTTQGSRTYNFCNGTFTYRSDTSGNSGTVTSEYGGTWKVEEAEFQQGGSAVLGRVSYTSTNPDYPAGQVRILIGANQAIIENDGDYQRTAGAAAC